MKHFLKCCAILLAIAVALTGMAVISYVSIQHNVTICSPAINIERKVCS